MSRRLESAFDSAQGEDWFSIPVFFVLMRETLEVMVVVSCMYNALEKLNLGTEKKQLAYGCLSGFFVDIVIGVVLISVFYTMRKNAFDANSNAEIIFEGTLMLFTCIVVTIFALGLSKFIDGLDSKINRKLESFTETVKKAASSTATASQSATVDEDNSNTARDEDYERGREECEPIENDSSWVERRVAIVGVDEIMSDASVELEPFRVGSGSSSTTTTTTSLAARPRAKEKSLRAHRRNVSPAVLGSDHSNNTSTSGGGDNGSFNVAIVPASMSPPPLTVIGSAPPPVPIMTPEEMSKLRWGLWSMSFMAIVREGLECIVFLAGLTASYSTNSMIFPAIAGVLVGLALGYLFIRTSRAWAMVYFVLISVFMLFAIGGGLISRAFTEFKELGMSSGPHLYNARSCCNQNTPFWGFLRVIFGYNDKPSVVEFLVYALYWIVVIYLAHRKGILTAATNACKVYHIAKSDKTLLGLRGGIDKTEVGSREPLLALPRTPQDENQNRCQSEVESEGQGDDQSQDQDRGSSSSKSGKLAFSSIALIAVTLVTPCQGAGQLCLPTCSTVGGIKRCSFTATVNIFASTMGYFRFAECGASDSPTLGIYPDVATTFYQHDSSNWYHPLGFAYLPDGLHKSNGNDERELDPGVTKTGSDCALKNTCMAPMYFLNATTTSHDSYLGGNYTNMPEHVKANKDGFDNDFGLDGIGKYEESFGQTSLDHWIAMGHWSVKLKWTDAAYTKDLFYFCHIHDNMSGRIKLLKADGSDVVQSADDPPLEYEYESVSAWDASCGTNHLEQFANNPSCAVTNYLCQQGVDRTDNDNEDKSRRLSIEAERRLAANTKSRKFDECLAAMDCAMHHDMKRYSHPTNPAATFVYQMIPHHLNAINMAKSLLSMNYLKCDEAEEAARLRRALQQDEGVKIGGAMGGDKWRYQRKRALTNNGAVEDEYAMTGSNCQMISMLKSIVNDQNAQVTMMRQWLAKAEMAPEAEKCPNVQAAITDTPIPFFILLGVLSAFVALSLVACKTYQWGVVEGREYEYGRLAGNDNDRSGISISGIELK